MNIYDLEVLQKTDEQFDLDQKTYNYSINAPFFQYIVDRSEEMRIDLICNSIYGNTNEIGFLMYFNNIDNPLNIKSGDIIRYVEFDLLGNFKISSDDRKRIEFLQNLNRDTRMDTNRIDYQKKSANPTFNTSPIEQVVDRGNIIVVGNRE
jgi:hypothetical protein